MIRRLVVWVLFVFVLAGLGVSMSVLVPFPPEWRWGLAGNEAPWFGGMRVHRQSAGGAWNLPAGNLA